MSDTVATAPAAAPVIEFVDDVQPTRGKDNPYASVVKLIAGTDKVKAFTVPTDEKEINKAKRLLTEAGHAAGVTVRSHADDSVEGRTKIRFWTTKRIMRKTPAERAAEKAVADAAKLAKAKANADKKTTTPATPAKTVPAKK